MGTFAISDCTHHGIKEWMLLQSFYHGLNQKASKHLDAAAKGSFLSLTTRQANTLMQKISKIKAGPRRTLNIVVRVKKYKKMKS
jgi:hypothetical protein